MIIHDTLGIVANPDTSEGSASPISIEENQRSCTKSDAVTALAMIYHGPIALEESLVTVPYKCQFCRRSIRMIRAQRIIKDGDC